MIRSSILGASTMLNVLIQRLPLQSLFLSKTWRAFPASYPITIVKKKVQLLYLFSLSSQVALMGFLPWYNGPFQCAPSFEPCPLEDVPLECFLNFPKMKNQDLLREILFQEIYLIKILSHDMAGPIACSRV